VRRRILIIVGALLLLLVGYGAGHKRLLGRFRDPPQQPPNPKAAPVEDIEALIDRNLKDEVRRGRLWSKLISSGDAAEAVAGMRRRLAALLPPWPGPEPAGEIRREEWFRRDRVKASILRFETHPGVTLECALLEPQESEEEKPALLVLHGMNGDLDRVVEDLDYHHGFGMALARRGYVVLAPFMVMARYGVVSGLSQRSMAGGWTLDGIELCQLRIALDHLSALGGVDPGRLGVYGISRGGQLALRLAALDERLAMTVCSGYFTDRMIWQFENPRAPLRPINHVNMLPGMGLLLDDLNLVAMIRPRSLVISVGEKDKRHPGAKREFRNVKALYEDAGHPNRASFVDFPGQHETAVERVLPHLDRWAFPSKPR